MRVVRSIPEVRRAVREARQNGLRVGLVPTMGFLHEGHLSLVDRCRESTDFVVLSIFVNPMQFGPSEDFDNYPRDLGRDLAAAEGRSVDLVFAPTDTELYPESPATVVTPRRLADRLCGAARPGHFEGVLTVVAKLLGIVQPDVGVFGQKDFQQSVLITRMVEDLNMPVTIEVAPTVREPDGLAMSSRNEYLSEEERSGALHISRALAAAVAAYRSGVHDVTALRSIILPVLEATDGLDVEYLELVSARDLEPAVRANADTVVAVAARAGTTRLIDNVRLADPDPGLSKLQ